MWYLHQLKEYLNERRNRIQESAKKKLGPQKSGSSEEETKDSTETATTPTQEASKEAEPEKTTDEKDEKIDISSPPPRSKMSKMTDYDSNQDVWDS